MKVMKFTTITKDFSNNKKLNPMDIIVICKFGWIYVINQINKIVKYIATEF